ncbi:iron ABC transporter substrate-binding protein [Alsobacter metallidurans]|uniref:Iron ABC transporter substrate-binding protein n=1 Tax=Alsobacter metallidurans TaxID=340221 RepID=A0A917I715_9HYPH|nr:ABC transporter substrate-binding protein [Alsobacter metallidurans]GGH16246.1 iron ABC transporter substrate-binding protein [Alsobacter metallidurans]
MIKLTRRYFTGAMAGATAALLAPRAFAQAGKKLTLYMGPPEATCTALAEAFEKISGGKPTVLRLSAGEAINRIRAERNAPQASVLYGIGLPSMMTLKADGLLQPYRPNGSDDIPAKYRDPDGFWTGTDVDFIGFACNKTFLAEKKLKAPQSWEDLLRPEFTGQICLGSPATSGTGYTFVTTVLQVMGQEKGWAYLKRFDANVAQYTRSGIGPTQLVGRGEVGIGILFAHDILGSISKGFPIEMSLPQEGTGYDLFCAVLLKGAPEADAAKQFLDWAVSPASIELLAASEYYDVPTNPKAKVHDLVKPWQNAKLIDFDFAWAGASATRQEIITRFQNEILAGRK